MQAKTVLVAGASSGLGLAVAREAARAGHRVFAGARSYLGQEGDAPEGFYRLALDVTDPASAARAVGEVERLAGPIDALILCAARIVYGSCEETSSEELRAVLDTNLVGVAQVVQAALPSMRARKSGLIVPFSSINGLVGTPFTGAYVASKHAVEGWAECLRMECGPFGIQVCVVRPGDHRSGGAAYRQYAAKAESPDSPYAAACARGTATIARDEAGGGDPERLARIVTRLIERGRPGQRTVARIDQRLAVWLHGLLPTRLFSRILGLYYLGAQRGAQKKKGGHT
ncbi:MAG: SDR family oxidoreductase [Clostridia bacterium]|nr:SDR family oxidoreductase [Clostridia bacterium]